MPDINSVVCYKLTAVWAPEKNCSLADSFPWDWYCNQLWQWLDKDVVNQCLGVCFNSYHSVLVSTSTFFPLFFLHAMFVLLIIMLPTFLVLSWPFLPQMFLPSFLCLSSNTCWEWQRPVKTLLFFSFRWNNSCSFSTLFFTVGLCPFPRMLGLAFWFTQRSNIISYILMYLSQQIKTLMPLVCS